MNQEFDKFKKIAYLPIDIPYEKLDLDELEVFHDLVINGKKHNNIVKREDIILNNIITYYNPDTY